MRLCLLSCGSKTAANAGDRWQFAAAPERWKEISDAAQVAAVALETGAALGAWDASKCAGMQGGFNWAEAFGR